MEKLKRTGMWILAVCLLFGISGCGKEKEEPDKAEYHMYYLALSESSLYVEDFIPKERTTEAMVGEIVEKLKEVPDKEECLRLLPEKVHIEDYVYEGQTVRVNFNDNYQKMKNTREILARAGIVKALTQLPGVTYVEFLQEGEPMQDFSGTNIGRMDKNMFVENEGKNINSYVHTNLNLYFANETGESLAKETVSAYYSSNVPLEKEVVERLLKGPKSPELSPTLSPNTKILGVSIMEGICYVNLDKSFMTDSMNVQEKLPIYSIVNSLTDACGVRAVQISVEGETKVTFRESMKLEEPYQADYTLLEEGKDE